MDGFGDNIQLAAVKFLALPLPIMRLSQLFTLGLAATALAHPVAEVEADVSELQPVHTLEKRASYFYSCQVVATALKHRTCPSTSCTAVGQYPNGKILKTTKTSLDHIPYVEPLIGNDPVP